MGWLIEQSNGKNLSLPVKILSPEQLKVALSPLAWKTLQLLSGEPCYPKQIAKKLRVHEQKIYYHIRNLEKKGLIEKVKEETVKGAIAKYYSLTEPAFALILKPLTESPKIFSVKTEHRKFLEPFVDGGKLNAVIVMGSPEPHGSLKVRAKDGPAATNIGLFLGSFLTYTPNVSIKLDTEIRDDDLKNNLIIIGGPGVNSLTAEINRRLPVRFETTKKSSDFYSSIYSSITDKDYTEENIGLIVKSKNPFDKTKDVLVIAGRRTSGTKAATLAFLQNFDEICKGNKKDKKLFAKVVEGLDKNNDGDIDSVEFLE